MTKYLTAFTTLILQLPAITHSFHSIVPFTSKSQPPKVSQRFVGSNGDRESLEQQLQVTKDVIQKIDLLEASIRHDEVGRDEATTLIETLEQSVDQLTATPICPAGLSMEDFQKAIRAYITLPLSLKLGLYLALDMKSDTSPPYPTVAQIPEIVARLYEQRQQLTAQKLEDCTREAQQILRVRTASTFGFPSTGQTTTTTTTAENADEIVFQLLGGASVDQVQSDNVVKQQLGRVTRKEGTVASKLELDTLMAVLRDKTLFVVKGDPVVIPGGYVLRGTNCKKTPKELIETLDKNLPKDWKGQVSLMSDVTASGLQQEAGMTRNDEPVLVLLNKDFSSESSWIFPISTAVAAITTFLYGLSVYSKNESMATELADRSALGDPSGFDVFNGHLVEVFVPLAIIQILHELGHYLIAQNDKFDISAPTLLPFYDKLPNLGFRTNIKSSPPNLTSLFDFAFIGPLMGTITSIIFLTYGIQATLMADPDTLQYFPALTVEEIKLSTLGGGIVDFLFGGSGVITSQNPGNSISLHPFAIGGFAGLIIQSVELLPLGSNDGGRISQAIFGRSGHLLVGGGTWFALLVATVFVDQSSDILLGAWAINNVVQNDMEIPCREEVTKVDLFRSAAAFGLWFVAILAIVPLQ